MTKGRVGLMLVLCCSIALFAVRTQSATDDPNQTGKSKDSEHSREMTEQERMEESKKFLERLRNMTPDQAIKAFKKRARERDKIRKQLQLERFEVLAEEGRGPLTSREQSRKMTAERRRQFLMEKAALGATEEQWKLIKAKLERIRKLHEQTNSTVRMLLIGGSSDKRMSGRARTGARSEVFQWWLSWKNKIGAELTETRKLAEQLVALLGRSNTTPQAFRHKMDALRKARADEADLKKLQLSEVRKELRELLTTREEAALTLMWGWL